MVKTIKYSQSLQQRAKEVIPLGVHSNFRYWGEGITPYVEKAKGSYLWDVDGNKYIDYRLAFGPVILGHAYEPVDAFVQNEMINGLLFAMTSELEIQVAEKIISLCPAVEMVRFACSGTEATMHALRLARAYTGREIIVKFEGMYHGFQDYTLFSTYAPVETYGNRNNPIPIPASSGIPKALHNLIITLSFNDFEVLEKTFDRMGYQIAAVIAEPCMGNCGCIEPEKGFLELIQEKCKKYGALFILDEVKTGFRIARGGAQEYYHLDPDLATYAKALGNGYPIAAIGGKKEIMNIIGHGVAQGGTYNNNKCGVAAAYATLDTLQTQPIMETIERRGNYLMKGIKQIFDDANIPAHMSGYPAMFSFSIGEKKPTNQREWNKNDRRLYLEIIEACIEQGVMPDPDPREPWFLCYSHSDEDMDETLNIFADVVKNVKIEPSR
ncbi:MAG: guanitoxin biosynthesis PLP-dependent transaminase GntE [Anaerolineaceae bacterium]